MAATERMLAILKMFTAERSELTVERAAEELGSSLSTTYRYFASLATAGLVDSVRNGVYVLGPAAIEMDWLIRRTDPLTSAAVQPMRMLAGDLDRPAVLLLCRLYRRRVMCVADHMVGFPSFASGYERGRPMPLFRGAASKIILANLPERVVADLLRRHPAALGSAALGDTAADAKAILTRQRRTGLSVTSGEVDPGLVGIAAPVTGPDGIVGSIAYVFAQNDLDDAAVRRFGDQLRSAGARISAALNGDGEES